MTTRPINSKSDWESLPAGTTATGILTGSDQRAKVIVTRGSDEDPIAPHTWRSLWARLIDITVEDPALTIVDPSGTRTATAETLDAVQNAAHAWLNGQEAALAKWKESSPQESRLLAEFFTISRPTTTTSTEDEEND